MKFRFGCLVFYIKFVFLKRQNEMRIIIRIKNLDLGKKSVKEKNVEIAIDDNLTCGELYSFAIKSNIIPNLNSEDTVWVVRIEKSYQIFNYFSKNDRYFYCNYHNHKVVNVCKLMKTNVFEFEFYSSPIHRAKELFLAYDGNFGSLGKDGWMEVYGYCKVPKELENEWFDVI